MTGEQTALAKATARALVGGSAHRDPATVFGGLDWNVAGRRVDGVAHTVFQILSHMVFWQDWVMSWLDGKKLPSRSGEWPSSDGPASREEWERAVGRFRSGLDELARCAREADLLSRRGRTSRLEMLQTAIAHNSYHAGQVVILRQMLGTWPPPSRRRGRRAA